MIIYMSDMTDTRPSPAYSYDAGDCIFIGSKAKGRPRCRGSRLLQAGGGERLCGDW